MGRLTRWFRPVVALTILSGCAFLLSSSSDVPFSVHQKAYYADPKLIDFVRPGLVLKILSVDVAPDKTVRVRFKLTDPKGIPLDIDGNYTPGPIRVLLVMAYIPADSSQYVTLTTRPPAPNPYISAQPFYDTISPTFQKVSDGVYDYTFTTKLPANDDPNATHSIGIRAARNLSDFRLPTDVANEVIHFLPSGGEVKRLRDVVRTATCNSRCHDPLQVYPPASSASAVTFGGNRTVEMCVMCHNPGNIIPATGQSVNFPVFIHKIHMGADLPSVIAGKPYKIGNSDFSEIEFPADVRNCEVCHDPKSGAAQADAWLKPSRAACGACHDDVNFATGENHSKEELPQVSDNLCGTCHIPQGELEFDPSIRGAHTIARFSRDLPGVVLDILDVADGSAGKRPIVTFSVKDKSGKPILPSEMNYLALVLAGPTTDYAGMTVERVEKAEGTTDGRYFWTFQNPIAAGAKGTFSVGIEGYRSATLLAGTRQERTARDVGPNKVFYFSVDGSRVEPRRIVVAKEKCNACHFDLVFHGTVRNKIEHCVQCHNPNQTDAARRPADALPAQTIAFKTMIHRIHTGKDSTAEYTVYGGRPFDFTKIAFPGDRRNCDKCHVNDSQQLPLKDNLLPVVNPRGLLNPMGPAAAACLGCHTSRAVAAHAYSMTTPIGEACAACHGLNSEFSVNRVHAR